MRNILLASVGLMLLSETARAEVAVIDWSGLTQAIKAFGVELQTQAIEAKQLFGDEISWATQAQQYAMQGRQYITETTELAALVHAPSLGAAMGALNMAGLGNALPISPYSVMGLVNGVHYGAGGLPQIQGVLGSLSGFTSSAYTANHVYTPDNGTWASTQTIARANSIAGMQGAAQASVSDYQAHQAALQALRDRLAISTTPKDVQDIQAQIGVEQLWFSSEAGQTQAITAAYTAQRDADVQQDNERLKQSFNEFINSN